MREHSIDTTKALVRTAALLLCVALGLPPGAPASPQSAAASVEVSPQSLRLEVGAKTTLSATVKDAAGNVIDAEVT
jgi:hypothetical protein